MASGKTEEINKVLWFQHSMWIFQQHFRAFCSSSFHKWRCFHKWRWTHTIIIMSFELHGKTDDVVLQGISSEETSIVGTLWGLLKFKYIFFLIHGRNCSHARVLLKKQSPVIFSHSSKPTGLDFMQFKTMMVPIVLAYIIIWTLLWLYRLFFCVQ